MCSKAHDFNIFLPNIISYAQYVCLHSGLLICKADHPLFDSESKAYILGIRKHFTCYEKLWSGELFQVRGCLERVGLRLNRRGLLQMFLSNKSKVTNNIVGLCGRVRRYQLVCAPHNNNGVCITEILFTQVKSTPRMRRLISVMFYSGS